MTIDDLIPGSRYKFRIKSENSYGISDPGEESNPFDVGGVSSDRSVALILSIKSSVFFLGYKLVFDDDLWDIFLA